MKQDLKKAAEYFKKSSEKENAWGMYYLASLLRNGNGIKKNIEKSIKLFKKSSEKGNHESTFILANIYCNGEGMQKDTLKGVELFEICARNGNFNAFYNLGIIFFDGDGVPKDYHRGFSYFEKSAEKGNIYAMLILFFLNFFLIFFNFNFFILNFFYFFIIFTLSKSFKSKTKQWIQVSISENLFQRRFTNRKKSRQSNKLFRNLLITRPPRITSLLGENLSGIRGSRKKESFESNTTV